jgi:tetratricopeptide (TPR) repeat protein
MNEQPQDLPSNPLQRWAGPGLFLSALVLYLATLARWAAPGESAQLIAQHTGLDPIPPLGQPLWGWLVRLFAAIPAGDFVTRINAFSALCGAGAVWAMYALVAAIPHNRTYEEKRTSIRPAVLRSLSGLTAAVLLATTQVFWMVSTRAHPSAFNTLLMLSVFLLFVRFWYGAHRSTFLAFAFLYGLGMVEYPLLILFAPPLLLATLMRLWQATLLKPAPLLQGGACFLAGALLFPVAALQLRLHPAFDWFELGGYHEALLAVARYSYRTLRAEFSRPGWILVFIMTVLPWGIVFVPKKVTHEAPARWGSYLLHALLTVVGFVVFYRLEYSPLVEIDAHRLNVAHYALMAMWMGYLAGYWLALIGRGRRFAPHVTPPPNLRLRLAVFLPALALLLLGGVVRNAPLAQARSERAVLTIAETILTETGARPWLISNGVLDPQLMILAHQRGVPLTLLNLRQARSTPYMRYVASLFDDPREQSLAAVGLSALLANWFTTDPDIDQRVAVLEWPDYWYGADQLPVPRMAVYLGVPPQPPPDPAALLADHRAFWKALDDWHRQPLDYAPGVVEWCVRHLGRVANDLGVLLEEAGDPARAKEAYRQARRIDPDNLSVLLNLQAAAERAQDPEAAALEAELERQWQRQVEKPAVWELAAQYGYVRNPALHFARGRAWAASGKAGAALRELQRAADLQPGREEFDLQVLAAFQVSEQTGVSEAALLRLLEQQPDHTDALYGLVQLSLRRHQLDDAHRYLQQLQAAEGESVRVRVETAHLTALRGDTTGAAQQFQSITTAHPDSLRAWSGRAMTALRTDAEEDFDLALQNLLERGGDRPDILLAIAQMHVQAGQHDRVPPLLERILLIEPGHARAQEMMLVFDWEFARKDQARERIHVLLSQDPTHPLANHILGTIQISEGLYALAESSFRASLQGGTLPDALINLAWLLQLRGAYDEALPLAAQALARRPADAAAWYTAGLVLLRLDRLDEAGEALQQALEIAPDSPLARLYTGFYYERQGLTREARSLLEAVLEEEAPLPAQIREEAREVLRRLRGDEPEA